MPVHLGGPTARKVISRRDMQCAFHYINEEETACFYSKFRKDAAGRPYGAYCIPLSEAYRFAEQRELFAGAARAAKVMGFDPHSRVDLYKIMDFIQDMLIELCTMEPVPDSLRAPTPQFDIQRDGNRIIMTSDRVH